MSYLKRRFDVQMLRYIVEHGELLRLASSDYETISKELQTLEFVKEYPELQSHLLHDEIQRIFATYLLPEIDKIWNICAPLYKLIVEQYYEKQITEAQAAGNREYERELRAEQLGYVLDRETRTGVERYKEYRLEIEGTRDYDLEELLWGEVQDHLARLEDRGYALSLERAQWLWRQSRFDRAESQYLHIFSLFDDQRKAPLEISLGLGHVLLRQGKIQDAVSIFEQSRELVESGDSRTFAFIHNNLGQAHRAAGRWDEALQHYGQALATFAFINDRLWMAGVYSNRGYIHALKGDYNRAKQQCQKALELLGGFPPRDPEAIRFRTYALLNMGTACRHSGDYESAAYYYKESLKLAEPGRDLEAVCHCQQNLGINACLAGRRKRWEHRSITDACKDQNDALDYISRALLVARPARWRWALGDGLSRLARVFEEIARLSVLSEASGSESLTQLVLSANTIEVPEELEFEYQLVSPGSFGEVEWLGKATSTLSSMI
jgi:tetratricopeptide (TPR) repeat protein